MKITLAAAVILTASFTTQANPTINTSSRKALTSDGARAVIGAAVAQAHRNKTTGVIAVVDDGGNLMALERIDGTFSEWA